MDTKKNKTLIASALTSTLGIFISKMLGIVYVIPFTRLIGESDIIFYTHAYTFYDYILTLSIAGLPYAISMVVSRYYTKEDFRTVLLVRKVALGLLMTLGVSAFVFLLVFATPIARQISPAMAEADFVNNIKTVLTIISFALLVVPILSCLRGFYQGQKEFVGPVISEIVEQLARVTFLLVTTFLCVLVFHGGTITAVNWAVGAAVFAALCSLVYLLLFDRKRQKQLVREAKRQPALTVDWKMILKELVICGLPFLLASLIGEANGVINATFFAKAMSARGESEEFIKVIYSVLNFSAFKLTSIPQVLAIGFGVAIIPVLTSSIVKHDYELLRRQINDAFNTATYIALPIIFCLMYFSTPVYATFYGYENYLIGGEGLFWACLLAVTGSIFPLASSMAMAIRLRRKYILSLLVGLTFKLCFTYLIIYWIGYQGAMITSALSALLIFLLNLFFIGRTYQVTYGDYLLKAGKMLGGVLVMFVVAKLLALLGLHFGYQSQLHDLLVLGVYGLATCFSYLLVTWLIKLPQEIFKFDLTALLARFSRGKKS